MSGANMAAQPKLERAPLPQAVNVVDLGQARAAEIQRMELLLRDDTASALGLLTQGVPGVPQDTLAFRRGPLGSSPDSEIAIGNAHTLVPGPLARL
jgi:hypothetical protein